MKRIKIKKVFVDNNISTDSIMKITHVYTDGSVFNNQRRESMQTFGGIGVFFGDNDPRNVSEPFFEFPITNNRTEFKAQIKAVENFMQDKIKRQDQSKEKLILYTDSRYTMDSMTKWINKWKKNKWKTANGKDVLNKDLIYQLDHLFNLYKDFLVVEYKWIRAHREGKNIPQNKSSSEYEDWYGNMMADKFAKRGSTIAMKGMT